MTSYDRVLATSLSECEDKMLWPEHMEMIIKLHLNEVQSVISANRGTIIFDYFYFHGLYDLYQDYCDYISIIPIIFLQKLSWLYAIIALSPKRRLFHLLQYDYFTYCFWHIFWWLFVLYQDNTYNWYNSYFFFIPPLTH